MSSRPVNMPSSLAKINCECMLLQLTVPSMPHHLKLPLTKETGGTHLTQQRGPYPLEPNLKTYAANPKQLAASAKQGSTCARVQPRKHNMAHSRQNPIRGASYFDGRAHPAGGPSVHQTCAPPARLVGVRSRRRAPRFATPRSQPHFLPATNCNGAPGPCPGI